MQTDKNNGMSLFMKQKALNYHGTRTFGTGEIWNYAAPSWLRVLPWVAAPAHGGMQPLADLRRGRSIHQPFITTPTTSSQFNTGQAKDHCMWLAASVVVHLVSVQRDLSSVMDDWRHHPIWDTGVHHKCCHHRTSTDNGGQWLSQYFFH